MVWLIWRHSLKSVSLEKFWPFEINLFKATSKVFDVFPDKNLVNKRYADKPSLVLMLIIFDMFLFVYLFIQSYMKFYATVMHKLRSEHVLFYDLPCSVGLF